MRPASFVLFIILIATIYFKWTLSISIIPERVEVAAINEKYVYNVSASVTRYGRKSTYYSNLVVGLKHTWGNNITIHMVFFEAQNYHYTRSLVELHMKLCDMLHDDQYFGKLYSAVLVRFKVSCPFPPGIYRFLNVTLPSEKFPNILPFQKGKVELTFRQLPTQDVVFKVISIFSIKTL